MRCVVSCSNTSFPWLIFYFAALLWGSMIHKHTGRWISNKGAYQSYLGTENCSCHSKLVSTLSMLLLSVLSLRVSQSWNLCQIQLSPSTKQRLVIVLPPVLTMPLWSSKASVVILSRNMLKRMGESRHPYRTSAVFQNQSSMLQLKRTALVALS